MWVRREGKREKWARGGRDMEGGRDRENDKGKCEMLKAIRILGEVLRNEIALWGRDRRGGGRAS